MDRGTQVLLQMLRLGCCPHPCTAQRPHGRQQQGTLSCAELPVQGAGSRAGPPAQGEAGAGEQRTAIGVLEEGDGEGHEDEAAHDEVGGHAVPRRAAPAPEGAAA